MWRRVIECLDVAVDIRSPLVEIHPLLGAVFGTYRQVERRADLHYRLECSDWPELFCNDELVRKFDEPLDLVPGLESDLYQRVIARASGIPLHAGGVLTPRKRALVFAGPSGSGKSTLVRFFVGQGFGYVSEECIAIDASGHCRGLARPFHAEPDEVVELPGTTEYTYPLRSAGHWLSKRLIHPAPGTIHYDPVPCVAAIALTHGPDFSPSLRALSDGEALSALWPAVFRPDVDSVEATHRSLSATRCYELRTATIEQARASVTALVRTIDA